MSRLENQPLYREDDESILSDDAASPYMSNSLGFWARHCASKQQGSTGDIIEVREPLIGDLDQMEYRLVLSDALDTKKRTTEEIRRTKRVIQAIFLREI